MGNNVNKDQGRRGTITIFMPTGGLPDLLAGG